MTNGYAGSLSGAMNRGQPRKTESFRPIFKISRRAILLKTVTRRICSRQFSTWAGSPVELDNLVPIVADLWGVEDKSARAADNRNSSGAHESFYDPRGSADTAPDQRSNLERLWTEICELPVKQRVALLLNLRDEQGRGVITLLPLIRIASIRQLAETLAMPPEQLAALWDDLPLDDATIAKQLGVTRQQVINLRKSARERLARRTKAFNK